MPACAIMTSIGKFYRCVIPSYPAFLMGDGKCVEISWDGASNGWLTLLYPDGTTVLLTGEEVKEVE